MKTKFGIRSLNLHYQNGTNTNMNYRLNNFTISTDKQLLDRLMIHQFLSQKSYWAKNISIEVVNRSIEHSLCYGVYDGTRQIGFARVITDYATTAYIGDVFIAGDYRGKGLSKWLMEIIITHPEMQHLRRWILATKDAHTLYEKSGFRPLAFPERWMEKHRPDAYL